MDPKSQSEDEEKKSSEETTRIAQVLDEIAFQTNLLALNAAVEAARVEEGDESFTAVAKELLTSARHCSGKAGERADFSETPVRERAGRESGPERQDSERRWFPERHFKLKLKKQIEAT